MKKKILFAIDILRGGGAEKVLIDIVKNLNKDKFDITVLSVFDGGKYVEEVKKYAKYTYIFPKYNSENYFFKLINSFKYRISKFTLRRLSPKLLYKHYVKEKYDYEVSFLEGYSATIISGSNNINSKKIAWIHTDLIENPWSKNYFKYQDEKDMYSKFDNIVCVSYDVKKAFEKKFNIKNTLVKYNPVDENLIRSLSNEDIDIDLGGEFLITTIGRLEPQKSYHRLLIVHKKLIELGYNYELWIIGEGSEKENLENYILENNLTSSVKLLGFKKNPYKYLGKSNLFVCSSLSEGFSTVATEATILGIPIVTTNCSGMEELLGDSEYGIITENSIEGLYNGLLKILEDKNLYNYYLCKAKERSTYFQLKNRMDEIEKLFK
ncbi:TPA: glycosyltransferase [Clostridium perfringens]|uniref:glycosyltransferase n=1 Tax=Clostridium perfringens TaxID=1502 RepID=UPI0018E48112|nr:glycosyltransferase [Clostridium perfringens]MBI5989772.1 glycosyltransferase [Clostridium perfringens]MDM1015779.1 glycosyltransferase [Clostridium perfringens]MDM1016895.1 glycosyltransferase [Clostridium perfringens]